MASGSGVDSGVSPSYWKDSLKSRAERDGLPSPEDMAMWQASPLLPGYILRQLAMRWFQNDSLDPRRCKSYMPKRKAQVYLTEECIPGQQYRCQYELGHAGHHECIIEYLPSPWPVASVASFPCWGRGIT